MRGSLIFQSVYNYLDGCVGDLQGVSNDTKKFVPPRIAKDIENTDNNSGSAVPIEAIWRRQSEQVKGVEVIGCEEADTNVDIKGGAVRYAIEGERKGPGHASNVCYCLKVKCTYTACVSGNFGRGAVVQKMNDGIWIWRRLSDLCDKGGGEPGVSTGSDAMNGEIEKSGIVDSDLIVCHGLMQSEKVCKGPILWIGLDSGIEKNIGNDDIDNGALNSEPEGGSIGGWGKF